MAKSADAADLKSAGPKGLWGFKSPSGHHKVSDLSIFLVLRPIAVISQVHVQVHVGPGGAPAIPATTDCLCFGDKRG